MLYRAPDLFLYPITIDASNRDIRFASGTWGTVSVAPGTYYLGVNLPGGYASLVSAIQTALNTASGTYVLTPATPTASAGQVWGGLKITRTSGSGTWGVDPVHASTTFPLTAILGFSKSTITGTENVITSDRVRGAGWHSYRRADRKLSNVSYDQHVNGGRGDVLQVTRWGRDKVRLFEYSSIPAAHVREGRSDESYAAVAKLATGDTNNKFQALWEAGIGSYEPVLCLHGSGGSSDCWDFSEYPYEVLQSLPTSEHATDLNSCIERENRTAEHYQVRFGMKVLSGFYGEG